LYADASKAEEEPCDAADGHVIALRPEYGLVRGTCSTQTELYPADFIPKDDESYTHVLEDLVLIGAHRGNRSIILDFTGYYLKVAYLLHTSIQFYTKEVWNNSIMCFHVGLALEFEDY
ncbi:hypothetical protein CPB84DRAFT_1668453, partial [Gymnopilus junonius]